MLWWFQLLEGPELGGCSDGTVSGNDYGKIVDAGGAALGAPVKPWLL